MGVRGGGVGRVAVEGLELSRALRSGEDGRKQHAAAMAQAAVLRAQNRASHKVNQIITKEK